MPHFITLIMVNVSHVLLFVIIRLMPTFSRQSPSLLEDLFQETIKQRTWITLTIIMVMKLDTYNFCKVPPIDVLHHIFCEEILKMFRQCRYENVDGINQQGWIQTS